MIVKSPGIVFKGVDFKDSSRIVTIFTKEYGKQAILFKGFKRSKSRFTGVVDHSCILNLVFFHKTTRSVQTIKETETRHATLGIRTDFEKLAISMSLIELADQVIPENEVNVEFYDFLEKFLVWLNAYQGNAAVLFPYLQLRVAELCGCGLQTESPPGELKQHLDIVAGTITPTMSANLCFPLSTNQLCYLHNALSGKSSALLKQEISKSELKTLIYHLDVYLKHHIEGLKSRKSDAVFSQILA